LAKATSLWRHRGFLLLWGGQTISQLGSQITRWALPLTAVLVLTQTIGVSAVLVGVVFAIGGTGGLLGALLMGRITSRVGLGPALLGGVLLAGLAELTIAGATGPLPLAFLMVAG
jgi:MFS family permease